MSVPLDKPDELLKIASISILAEIQPYLAAVAYNDEHPDQAFDFASRIIARLPESDENVAPSYNLKGLILGDRRQYADAEKELASAIKLKPNAAVYHANLAGILQNQGKRDQANFEYQRAFELAGDDYVLRAESLQAQGKFREAQEEFVRAVRTKPRDAYARLALANLLRRVGDIDKAVLGYRVAVDLEPRNAVAHYLLGSALSKDPRAVAEGRRAVELVPNSVNVRVGFADILLNQGDLEGALREASTALKIDSRDVSANVESGLILEALKRRKEAIDHYRLAIQIDPRDSTAHLALGAALEADGNHADALIPKGGTRLSVP